MNENNENIMSEIRQGLIQYIGAIGKESGFENDEAMQMSVSVVTEELLKFCNVTNKFNFYAAKPILRGAAYIVDMNIAQARRDAIKDNIDIDDAIKSFAYISDKLKKMADSYKPRSKEEILSEIETTSDIDSDTDKE